MAASPRASSSTSGSGRRPGSPRRRRRRRSSSRVSRPSLSRTGAVPYYTNYKDAWPLSEWNNHRAVLADPAINDKFPADAAPWQPGKIQYLTDGLLYDVVNSKLSEKDPLTTNWEGSKPMIATGKVATMLLGSWAVPQMRAAAEAAGANPDDIGFWPFPYQTGGTFHAAIDGDKLAAVSRNSENKATARAFLDWFVNDSGFAADQQAIPPAISQPLPARPEGLPGHRGRADGGAERRPPTPARRTRSSRSRRST
nr:hypothetical protein GCM10020092_071040 [Actinoplanes digitatis]